MEDKYRHFAEMNEEKRDDIIRAAIKEFAIFPYETASINRILEKAHFSKGGIYYYFSGKRDMYIGIAEYILEYYLGFMKKELPGDNGDILERLKVCGELQSVVGKKYPYYAEFICRISSVNKVDLPDELKESLEKMNTAEEEILFRGFDSSLLKEGVMKEEALMLITSAMSGVTSVDYMAGINEVPLEERHEIYTEKVNELLQVLRKVLYK